MLAAVVVLAVVVCGLLVERIVHERQVSADRRHLVNALVAKDGRDLALIERAAGVKQPAMANGERPQRLPEGL